MQPKPVTMNYTTLDDSALVERSRTGDADAFAELYRRYLTPVYRFIFRRVGGDITAAEDLTSQVFLEVFNGLSAYRERGRFASWLFTIARRRLADGYRKPKMDLLEDVHESLLGISDGREQHENMTRLKQLLATLDEEKRELLQLRFSAGLSFADMAAVLGRKEAAVKMSLYRVLDGLRAQWEAGNE
jgi:RNA polymerase sigma-70 factor (ECF subfamily)